SGSFVDSARMYRAWRALSSTPSDIALERDAAARAWWKWSQHEQSTQSDQKTCSRPLEVGADLLSLREKLQLDKATWSHILNAFATDPANFSARQKEVALTDALRAIVASQYAPELASIVSTSRGGALRDSIAALARQVDRV